MDAQKIADIREQLRTSGDDNLCPLGHNLTDDQIRQLDRFFKGETRPRYVKWREVDRSQDR